VAPELGGQRIGFELVQDRRVRVSLDFVFGRLEYKIP
jgi:hypothetical protein